MATLPLTDKIGYRPEEAAAVVGIGRTMLYELMRTGQLQSIKVGRARIIPRSALEELLITLQAEQSAVPAA